MSVRRGLMPGSAVYAGPPREGQVAITIADFDAVGLDERSAVAVEAVSRPVGGVRWINVDGVHQADVIKTLSDALGIHPLAMEDVLNPSTRAKADDYGDTLFVAARMARIVDNSVVLEQVALVLGRGWVVSFQEEPGDVFDSVRRRMREGLGRMRRSGGDYLLYALMDAVVDGYFVVLDLLEEQADVIEEQALGESHSDLPREVHALKGEIMALRRVVWPLREAVSGILRVESELIAADTRPFLRDLLDHLHQAIETLDGTRDRLSAALELHLALNGHRLNEVMRVLTVVATIFIPLTFIAGLYGMNFEYMPELGWHWAYPTTLGAMALIGVGMVVAFRRRGWM